MTSRRAPRAPSSARSHRLETTMSGKHQAPTATVKFPHRSRRGILLGLTAPQLIVASLTGLLLLAVVLTRGVVGALQLIPLWAVIALFVFVRHRGRALAEWAPIVTRYVLRRMRGQLVWLTRPSRRPTREGLLHLPGTAASLRVVTAPDDRYGAVHDPHSGTLTAVVKVSSRAYALLDPGTQQANVNGWGRALAALARTGQIARIQVIERTVPDSGDALRRYWEEHGLPHAPTAGAIYSELIQSAGPAAAPHEAYVAVALDIRAARRLINQAKRWPDRLLQRPGAADLHLRPGRADRRAQPHRLAHRPRDRGRRAHRLRSQGPHGAGPVVHHAAVPRPSPPQPDLSWSSRRRITSRPTRPSTPRTGWRTGRGPKRRPASCTSSCSPAASGARCRSRTSRRDWTPRCATSSARRPA